MELLSREQIVEALTRLDAALARRGERAELYVEQFASRNLTVTCEPDA